MPESGQGPGSFRKSCEVHGKDGGPRDNWVFLAIARLLGIP